MSALPATVSTLLKTRRIPAVPASEVEAQIKRITAKRASHKSTEADERRLVLMRAAQLLPAARGNRRSRQGASR